MLNTACDTELYICLIAFDSIHEACILTAERATYSIADVVAECTDLIEHVSVDLKSNLILRESWSRSSPSLTVDNHLRIDRMQTLTDDIHSLDVVDRHKIETETVDMIFIHPPLEGLDHIFAEHGLLRGCLVAAA